MVQTRQKLHWMGLCFLLSFFLSSVTFAANVNEPITVYLTWQRDPTKTMTVQWITELTKESDDVYYQKVGDNKWEIAVGSHKPMPQKEPYMIHYAELTGLTPGAVYTFKIGDWNTNSHKFRTMPEKPDKPIRFVVGGDVYHDDIGPVIETNKQAAKVNPMFALVGGDIAYAGSKYPNNEKKKNIRWLTWLIAWKKYMVTPDGFLIPMVPAIGNHDVDGRFDQPPLKAPFFYSLFAFPGKQGYNALDFGDYLSLIILDSSHTHPVNGNQAHWLYHTLEKRKNVSHKFALYHVPAYPCVRSFKGSKNILIRQNWVPIFERFELTAAFENHEHAFKRSHPIYQGRVDPRGVLYLGDGAWGVKKPRMPKKPNKEWYLAKTIRARHFIMVTLDGNNRYYTAINSQGRVIDRHEQVIRPTPKKISVNL